MHIVDPLDRIGTQDLGPPGLQIRRAQRRVPNPTLYDIPELPHGLCVLRDLAYTRGREGREE
jgi:hypothetical protein